MHILKSIEVHGFRGQSKIIRLALRPDANFIIGRNGTGKTTLINLIHAALALDTDVLKEIEFERLDLRFREKGSTKTPLVSVFRQATEEAGNHVVRATLREFHRKANLSADHIRDVALQTFPAMLAGRNPVAKHHRQQMAAI